MAGPVLLPSFLGCVLLLFGSALSAYATTEALANGTIPLTSIQIGSFLNGNLIAGQENVGKALGLGMVVIIAVAMAAARRAAVRAGRQGPAAAARADPPAAAAARRTTTLFVTHDQEEALSMADRVGVMSHGRLEQIAAPDELYTRPATAFVAEFVGVMNRIPGELRDGGMVTALGSTVPVRGDSQGDPAGTAVDVLVRPEGLAMEAAEHGNGIVTTRTFLGSVTRIGVQLDGDVAVLLDRPSAESAALAPGASVSVSLPPQPVLVAARRAG